MYLTSTCICIRWMCWPFDQLSANFLEAKTYLWFAICMRPKMGPLTCPSVSPSVCPSVSPFVVVVVVSLANSCHWGNSSSFRCGSSWNALWYVQPRSSSRGLFSIRSLMCQKCFKCFSKKKNQIYNKKPNWNLQTIRGLASEKKKYERIKLKSFFTARFSYFVAMCT